MNNNSYGGQHTEKVDCQVDRQVDCQVDRKQNKVDRKGGQKTCETIYGMIVHDAITMQ